MKLCHEVAHRPILKLACKGPSVLCVIVALRSIVLFFCDAGNMKLNRNTSRPIIRFPSERINILTHFAQDVGFVARKVGPFVALERLRMVWHACITVMSFLLPEPPLPLSSGTR